MFVAGGAEHRIGGFFGSIDGQGKERVIPWGRSQQAAYLIVCWTHLHESIKSSKAEWVEAIRSTDADRQEPLDLGDELTEFQLNAPLSGASSLLGTDQGARAVLVVFNALSQVSYDSVGLDAWEFDDPASEPDENSVSKAIASFKRLDDANDFLRAVADGLVNGSVDWRTSSAPNLKPEQVRNQSVYRGSSGYRALQQDCLRSLIASKNPLISSAAGIVAAIWNS